MASFMIMLCVIALTNSGPADAAGGHVDKRTDDQGPLEAVVMKLTADLNALTATVNALQAKLGKL